MIDFSKAFDRVSHPILLSKLSKLELSDRAINWIISYPTERTQVVKCNGSISLPASIPKSFRDLVLVQCYMPLWKVISTPVYYECANKICR